MVQVTYQKNDGCIIQKFRKTLPPYKIGDTTSMGWKLLNVEYEYKDKYYSAHDYNMLMAKSRNAAIRKKQTIDVLTKEVKTFVYYFVILAIINYLKILLGI